MDIQAEKQILMEQLGRLQGANTIARVKDFLQSILKEKDELLEKSIDRGVNQSKAGQVHSHKETMSEICAKYSA